MAKPEWGNKRICLNCGARFYDLNREPIVCPSCGTPYDAQSQARPRRARAPRLAAVPTESPEVPAAETEAEEEVTVEAEEDKASSDEETEEAEEEEEESESAIEDVSELADEDMADVIDTDVDEDEGER